MSILLRKVKIQDPTSPFHGEQKDIFIQNGIIAEISDHITAAAEQIVDFPGIHVSKGWVDTFSDFADPGFEHKENLESGSHAAAAGGFTRVFVVPNTSPALHSKSQIEYIIEKSRNLPITIHPIGAITKNIEGKELAEMYDMFEYQAVAFSDGFQSVQSAGLLIKALQYVKAIDSVIIQLPDDRSINPNGLLNEGIVSTQLGLPGKPVLAEELMVARDIKLAEYTNSKLHITGITSSRSVELIKKAKNEGIQISCSVTPHHLFFCDEDLKGYDTNLKVNLPLRSSFDKTALLQAVIEGTIDMIACHHQPQDWDNKTCEFEYAKNGMIGLESCFGVLGSLNIPEKTIIELLSGSPRKHFSLPQDSLDLGSTAEISIYDPMAEYIFSESHISSASKNSPFIGKKLKGRVLGIVHKGSLWINEPTK